MRAVIAIAGLAALIGMAATGSQDGFPPVLEGRPVALPTDAGAHADYRIEWWYVTGHLDSSRGPLGFQVTFFRLRNQVAEANPSFFSPRQLLFAHAALAHPSRAKLLHDERSARAIAGLAEAKEGSMDVRIDDWSLRQDGSVYRARIAADDFDLDLVLTPTQPAMLEGDRGYSR
jgi:predicted secreted hydrolase